MPLIQEVPRKSLFLCLKKPLEMPFVTCLERDIMSRIDKLNAEVEWRPEIKEGHPDYHKNLKTAQNFVEKTKESLIRGLSVKVCDSDHLSQSLLMVAWSPPKESKLRNFANPISLHQSNAALCKEIETVFNNYFKKADSYAKTNPQQLEIGLKA